MSTWTFGPSVGHPNAQRPRGRTARYTSRRPAVTAAPQPTLAPKRIVPAGLAILQMDPTSIRRPKP